MAILERSKLGSIVIAVAVASASLLVSADAEAAKVGLFRMKRTWWGGTSTASPADPYISVDFHPRLRGPQKAPPAEVYVGSTTVNGRNAPRFTGPGEFIINKTYYGACVPGTCFPGYPESKLWYSYWNVKGRFQPLNSRFGGASTTTTVVFKTTMGNPTPPLNQGAPSPPTTTPCVGGGLTGCGTWPWDIGTHMAGDPISYVGGNYDKSRAGSIMITPGKNRFGGTMHFFFGPNHLWYQYITYFYPKISKAYGAQIDPRTVNANTVLGDVQFGGAGARYQMTVYGQEKKTTGAGTPNSPGAYSVVKAPYFYSVAPFTTGMATVWEPFGNTNTEVTVTGYDNRTPNGISGVISLVRPRLVHSYRIPVDPNLPIAMAWASGSAWQMNFHFLPEPGSTAMVASGLVVLAGLYRMRRR